MHQEQSIAEDAEVSRGRSIWASNTWIHHYRAFWIQDPSPIEEIAQANIEFEILFSPGQVRTE